MALLQLVLTSWFLVMVSGETACSVDKDCLDSGYPQGSTCRIVQGSPPKGVCVRIDICAGMCNRESGCSPQGCYCNPLGWCDGNPTPTTSVPTTTTTAPAPTKPSPTPPAPTVTPTGCSSFTSVPPLSCNNIPQITNGKITGQVNLVSSWCSQYQPPGTTCKYPGYVLLESSNRTICHRVFNQWIGGIVNDTASQSYQYTVQGEQDVITVIIECDPQGSLNTVSCPEFVLKTGTPQAPRSYTVVFKSMNACNKPFTIPPTPSSTPPSCPQWMQGPTTCNNVPHFKDGKYFAMSTFVSNGCTPFRETPYCLKPSYASIIDEGKCEVPYDTWVSGPTSTEQGVSYSINNRFALSNDRNMTVTVLCDSMLPQTLGCPDSIITNNGHTDVVMRSPYACPAANCSPTPRINFVNANPIVCSNVAMFQDGVPTAMYTVNVNWCARSYPSPPTTNAPTTTRAPRTISEAELGSCVQSYIFLQNMTSACAQQFPSWKKGMVYNTTGKFVQYVVEDMWKNEVVVSIYCNPSSWYICPTSMTLVSNGTKSKYEIAIGSSLLC
eukprot:PhF_6_TR32977/c0_g1_i2/m.48561